MANARIAAGLVLTAGQTKHAEITQACAAWRDAQIAKVQGEPKIEGAFWRRTITTLTRDQAEAEYDRLVKQIYSPQWWAEIGKPGAGIGFSLTVQELARAALDTGDGFVTLDADEVRFLGLGAAA